MTREEAIETIRRCCPKISDSGCDFETAMRFLIPELRESEDERIRKRLIEYFEGFKMGNAEVRWEGLIVQEVLAWLEKQKEQKPAEWSEEDEKRIQRICDFLWKNRKGDTDTIYQIEKDADWLKSLRPQHRDYAITFWTYLDEHRPEGKMCLSNGECADIEKAFIEHDWAKILRYANKYHPHWKPSEEHMEALLWCIAHLGGADHRTLAELYEHLKQLM